VEHGDELQEDASSRHASVSSQDFVIVRDELKMVILISDIYPDGCFLATITLWDLSELNIERPAARCGGKHNLHWVRHVL
jgi:hypothetical protein